MKDLTHDRVELFRFRPREPTDREIGVKAGAEENFIRIDVPDPRDHLLVHQEGFDPATSLL